MIVALRPTVACPDTRCAARHRADTMTTPANRSAFIAMLHALGTKDYDTFERHLDADLVCEWPYAVMDGFPTSMTGARRLRNALEVSWVKFAPYRYQILELYDLAEPDRLIAEYTSHSTYLVTNAPYENRYVSIVEFRNGRISRWREYVNPLVTLKVLGPDAVWSEDKGAE
jgi:ketosteroid isomerase-like protein